MTGGGASSRDVTGGGAANGDVTGDTEAQFAVHAAEQEVVEAGVGGG